MFPRLYTDEEQKSAAESNPNEALIYNYIEQGLSSLKDKTPISELFAKVLMIAINPIKDFSKDYCHSRYLKLAGLRNLIYQAISNPKASLQLKNACKIEDSYLKNAFIDRLTYAVDLELLYYAKLQQTVDFTLKPKFIKILVEMTKNIVRVSAKGKDAALGHNIRFNTLMDYLPENKFRILFMHPDSLWANGCYQDYKNNTKSEAIRKELYDLFCLKTLEERQSINDYHGFLLNLRQEMLKIYDALAEKDQALMKYCADKKYNEKDIFDLNKATILAVLKDCESYNAKDYSYLKNEIKLLVQIKRSTVEEQKEWLRSLSDDKSRHDLLLAANQNDFMTTFSHDHNLIITMFSSILRGISVSELKLLLDEFMKEKYIDSLLSQVGDMAATFGFGGMASLFPRSLIMRKVKSLVLEAKSYVDKLETIQGEHPKKTKELIKKMILSRLSPESLLTHLPKGMHASISPYLQKIQAYRAGTEKALNSEDLLLLTCHEGDFDEAKPLLEKVPHFIPYFIQVLQAKKAKFAHQMLDFFISSRGEFFDVVPQEIKEQQLLLELVIQLSETDHKTSLKMLKKLLVPTYKWNIKLIEDLSKDLKFGEVQELLKQYQSLQHKDKKATRSTALFFSDKSASSLKIELCQDEEKCEQAVSIKDAAFSLDADPVFKLKEFVSAKASPDQENSYCYAITLAMLQYAQAYLNTNQENYLDQLSLEKVRQFRNALVHQHQADSKLSFSLIMDGEAKNLYKLAEALIDAIDNNDASKLHNDPLFQKTVEQGALLGTQREKGGHEHLRLYQRILYTQRLANVYLSFEMSEKQAKTKPEVIEHAKAMLSILRQLYCLRQTQCSNAGFDSSLAKAIRHSPLSLPEKVKEERLAGRFVQGGQK